MAGDIGVQKYLTEAGEESIGVVYTESCAESSAAAFRTRFSQIRNIFDIGESEVLALLSTFLFFSPIILKMRKQRSLQKQKRLQRQRRP